MNYSSSLSVRKYMLIALSVTINLLGGILALSLKLPIYMDSIGTVLVAFLFGPLWGAATGFMTSMLNGALFDYYSFFFAPVQIVLGFMVGIMKPLKSGTLVKKMIYTFFLTLIISIIASVIAAKLFGTVTSSGSSYIVQLLRIAGVPDMAAVFIVQFPSDYMDKIVAIIFASKMGKFFEQDIGIR